MVSGPEGNRVRLALESYVIDCQEKEAAMGIPFC